MNAPRRAALTLFAEKNALDADRIAIMMAEKGLAHDRVIVDPAHPPEDLLDLNPTLNMPAFITREISLYYPSVIMEYLDERFPHPPLLPPDPISRGRFRLMLNRIQTEWYPLVEKLIKTEGSDKKSTKLLVEALTVACPLFQGKSFFQSDDFSMIDCTLAPIFYWVNQFNISLSTKAEAAEDYGIRVLARGSVRHVLMPQTR